MRYEDVDTRAAPYCLEAVELAQDETTANGQSVLVEHWRIPAKDWRSMRPLEGDVVVAREGLLWVTIGDDPMDYVLRPGQSMPLKPGALTFFGPLNDELVRFRIRRRIGRRFAQFASEPDLADPRGGSSLLSRRALSRSRP